MRFIKNGPSIPNELLNARDEGRVVFFCGAGVSQARVRLPDFFGLAEAVIHELGVPKENDARKVLELSRKISKEQSVTGLISADRIFGLLEREFTVSDIQAAVARSLTPKGSPDLSAHKILLRLATTSDLKTRLVTTNFDRLFDASDSNLICFKPPCLPNSSRYDELNGIVYLHGRANMDYTAADGDGFVLSSSDFGYAYLSEGWATEFFRDIVRNYVVVFVGYSADDPPIHYLLEGFRRKRDSSHQIFAFHAGESDEAFARWHHKGVEAIPYSPEGDHCALWQTLEQWAIRADAPDSWRRAILDTAMAGPESLKPYQRGQIAHVVSTYEGAREFAERKPPAEWLCVFDPSCRYASPRSLKWFEPESPVIDPFNLYGLDSDATPETDTSADYTRTREIPSGARDAFIATSLDRKNLSEEQFSAVRGHYATHFPRLSRRLECLGRWIANVANQPATIWWAARQKSLHPGIRNSIEGWLERHDEKIDPAIRDAWHYLLEAWNHIDDEPRREWYAFKDEIKREGWGAAAVRRFTAIACPYLNVDYAIMSPPTPPKKDAECRLRDLIEIKVECPVPPPDIDIPNEWLEHVIWGFRKNIELAIRLCEEVDDMHRLHISPIVPDDRPDISDDGRMEGLSGYIFWFSSLFERLIEMDVSKARREFSLWPTGDDIAFDRLRFWAGGKSSITTPQVFCEIVERLSDDVFWGSYHQRDLLLVLAERWEYLTKASRKQIEDRLLAGPPQWDGQDDASYKEHRAWATLERLRWLADKKCDFSFDVEKEIAKRCPSAPKWKPEYAKRAAESREGRGGMVRTNTEHNILLREPIKSILSKTHELSGRNEDNFLEERDPFAGLCIDRPVRAYLALTQAARQNDYPEWAWKKFLFSSAREKDETKFSAIIAERLCRMPDEALSKFLYPSIWWLEKVGKTLSEQCAKSFDKATSRLIDVLSVAPSEKLSTVISTNKGRDRGTEALNSPTGRITMAILEDSRIESILDDVALSENWLSQLTRLLALKGDPRRQAIVMISHHLGWCYHHFSTWTEQHLLSILDRDDEEDMEALWAGFFWNPSIPNAAFYSRLKPALLALMKARDSSQRQVQSLAYLAISGWIALDMKGERQISNSEFHEALLHGGDEFRSHILWQIRRELEDKMESNRSDWLDRSLEFFQKVWPREKVVKNPTMSIRLCELLLSNNETFSKLVDAVLPLFTKITRGFHLYLRGDAGVIIDNHPERLLTVLHMVLPDEVSDWPYDIGDVLERIGAADSNLLSDTRLQGLMRKWRGR